MAQQWTQPKPNSHEAWVMLGWLNACIEVKGKLTAQDWNEAAEAAADEYTRASRVTVQPNGSNDV